MTVSRWLNTRTPPPPSLLAERLRSALGDDATRNAADASDICLAAAEAILCRLLEAAGKAGARDWALDLLTADALVTYAFEAASERPEELAERARRAISRISKLAVAGCP